MPASNDGAAPVATDRPRISANLKPTTDKDGYIAVRNVTAGTVAIDFLSGCVGTALATPFVAIVDGAIINRVNGNGDPILKGLRQGFKELFTNPVKFFTSYKWSRLCFYCWIVYAATFVTANLLKSLHSAWDTPTDTVKSRLVLATAAVNMGVTAFVKDPALVRVLQELARRGEVDPTKISAPKPVWWLPRALFMVRDGITMYATFQVASSIGQWIYRNYNTQISEKNAARLAGYIVPGALQIVSTPIHLTALELVSKPQGSVATIAPYVISNYPTAFISRVLRVVPAIGLGGNANYDFRDYALRYAERSCWL